jgi:hypothetical protein
MAVAIPTYDKIKSFDLVSMHITSLKKSIPVPDEGVSGSKFAEQDLPC